MSKSIVGIATTSNQVELTLDDLQSDGLIPSSDISVLMPDSGDMQDPEDRPEVGAVKATKAPEGATTGAVTGGAIGGTLGLLAGIGTLAIPGLGPFIAAGPIMAALSGAAAGAASRRRRRSRLWAWEFLNMRLRSMKIGSRRADIWWPFTSRITRREMSFGRS